MLALERLAELLAGFARVRVAVAGDFFLDRYLVTDPALLETSLETGRPARQVIARRSSPGHGGTVANNLRSLGVGSIAVVGFTGDDGEGYELRRALEAQGISTTHLVRSAAVVTGTYIKPTALRPDGSEEELERLDIKNRRPVPPAIEQAMVTSLEAIATGRQVDAIIIADQVEERNHGAITDRVREAICHLAAAHPEIVWLADSRRRIGEYRHVRLKPNRDECLRAIVSEGQRHRLNHERGVMEAVEASAPGLAMEPGPEAAILEVRQCAQELARRVGQTVFVTLAAEGALVVEPSGAVTHVPAVPAEGPIDPTGAGDATTAGIVPALALGATAVEAAALGMLVAAVTVRQLGTTGRATPDQVLALAQASGSLP